MLFVCVCKDPSTTELYTYLHPLSVHDSLPISTGHPDADRGAGAGSGGAARQLSGRELRMAGDPRPDGGTVRRHDRGDDADPAGNPHRAPPQRRSEEHTSEIQSLMRISYAVLCLKKKNK